MLGIVGLGVHWREQALLCGSDSDLRQLCYAVCTSMPPLLKMGDVTDHRPDRILRNACWGLSVWIHTGGRQLHFMCPTPFYVQCAVAATNLSGSIDVQTAYHNCRKSVSDPQNGACSRQCTPRPTIPSMRFSKFGLGADL